MTDEQQTRENLQNNKSSNRCRNWLLCESYFVKHVYMVILSAFGYTLSVCVLQQHRLTEVYLLFIGPFLTLLFSECYSHTTVSLYSI